jgi:hypothetical protein
VWLDVGLGVSLFVRLGVRLFVGLELRLGLKEGVAGYVGHSGQPVIANEAVTEPWMQLAPLLTQFVSDGNEPEKTQFVSWNFASLEGFFFMTMSRALLLKIQLSTVIPQLSP